MVEKINNNDLSTQQATSTGEQGARPTYKTTSVSRTLTPTVVQNLGSEVYSGDTYKMLVLAEEMEEKFPSYRNAIFSRKMAVAGLPFYIKATDDNSKSADIAKFVSDVLSDGIILSSFINILDALAKGYSVNEIIWNTSGKYYIPASIDYVDPTNFIFKKDDNKTLFLKGEGNSAIPLLPFKYIIHTPTLKSGITSRSGLAFSLAAYYLLQARNLNNWTAFTDRFGYPMVHGQYATNATEDDINALLKACASFGTDQAVVTSQGATINIVETSNSNSQNTLFLQFQEFLKKEVVVSILGQNLTSNDGASLSQALVHNEVRKEFIDFDSKMLANTLNSSIVKYLIDLNFGSQERYPQLEFYIEKKENLDIWIGAVEKSYNMGLPIPAKEIYRRLDVAIPAQDEEVLTKPVTAQKTSIANSLNSAIASLINKSAEHALGAFQTQEPTEIDNLVNQDEIDNCGQALASFFENKLANMQNYDDFLNYLNSGQFLNEFDFEKYISNPLALAQFKASFDGDRSFDKATYKAKNGK